MKALGFALAVCLCLAFLTPAFAAVPPAGYDISSRSHAEYRIDSQLYTAFSNRVTTRILPLYAVELTPAGTVSAPAVTLQGSPGDTLYALFTLINHANAPDSLAVGSSLVASPEFTPAGVVLFHDLNGNGTFDTGEDDPGYLALASEESVPLTAGVILPGGTGRATCYLEIQARSTSDAAARDASVIRIDLVTAAPGFLYIGPDGNPKALPGGEGSPDDFTTVTPGYRQTVVDFINEILLEGATEDRVAITLDENNVIPGGVTVTFSDTTGTPLPRASAGGGRYILERVVPGETRRIRVRISAGGDPLFSAIGASCAIPVRVQSLTDSTRSNTTIDILDLDDVVPPPPFISLRQTFKQQVASTGDIVSLIVTVKNISDSVAVDSLVVHELAQPSLQYLSSPEFVLRNDRLVWLAGSLRPGEERSTHIKFLCNGRMSRGKAKAIGTAAGVSEFGFPASAGPVITVLGIENDIFSADGVVLGEVFIDADGDGMRGDGEEGVPGVAVYLESGAYALTDSSGKFSLPHSFSGYRLVRLDESTLPAWVVIPSAYAADGNGHEWHTRLVHLLESGHAHVSFPLKRRPAVASRERRVTRSLACQEKVSLTPRNSVMFHTRTLSSSYFESGKAYLKSGVIDELKPVVSFLNTHPFWCVYLEGHTDSVPIHNRSFADNYELSVARAKAVQRFLQAQGVEAHRIMIRGFGESRPVATNRTAGGRSRNRRVEVCLVPPGLAVSDIEQVQRVAAGMQQLSGLPDSLQATVLWRVTTDSPDPVDARLSVRVPETISGSAVTVRADGSVIEGRNGTFSIPGFRKADAIDIEVTCPVAARDTALLDDITAAFQIDTVPPVLIRRSVDGAPQPLQAAIHPFQTGRSVDGATMRDIVQWQVVDRSIREAENAPASEIGGERGRDGVAPHDSLDCAIITPGSGTVFSKRDRITVRTRIPLGATATLECNGQAVPSRSIGEKIIELRKRREEAFWYGVKLRTGWNRIVLAATTVDGTVRSDTIQVALAGRPAVLECETQRLVIPADGRTRNRLRFAVKDELGLPVVDGVAATVVAGDSLVGNRDERPDRRGLQVTCEDGYFNLLVSASTTTGRKKITLALDGLEASCPVAYIPPERSFFISGIVDSRLRVTDATGSGSSMGLDDFNDGLGAEGVSRLFVQGTTYGGMNVTMRLDSRKRYEDPLLKTLNPEREYPIYGDASELHYAAPARGGNYIAVEKGESFARYGDFRTPLAAGEFLSYKRAATGVNARLTSGDRTFKGFITESDYTTFKDELPGDGTSGYYYLSQSPVVEFSEKIVLETRDRYQPEQILGIQPLIQNRDYTINYLDGAILFKEPVPVTDARFNPIMVVVIYEVSGRDTGRDKRYLYGVAGDIVNGERKRLQISAVARDGEGKGYTLYGASGNISTHGMEFRGEVARSEDEIAGAGNAFKLETVVDHGRAEGSLYLRRVDGDFLNPSFTGSAHELASLKAGYESKIRLFESLSLTSLGYRQRFYRTGERRENVDALLRYQSGGFTSLAGMRAAALDRDRIARHGVLGILGTGYERQSARFDLRWEKNVAEESVDDYPDRLRTSASINFLKRYRLALNHEYMTASTRGATHQAQIGIESRITDGGTAYTRYAMNRTASDERLGAILGLKQSFDLNDHAEATFNIENYHSLSGNRDQDYFALKTGLNLAKAHSYRVESRYELRWQRRATKHLLRMNGLKEVRPGVSVLFKEALSFYSSEDRDDAVSFDGRLALALRPDRSSVQSLLMVKSTYERFTPVNPEAVTWKLVCSGDVNYRPLQPVEIRIKYAMKYVEDYLLGESLDARSQLVLSQFIYRFARRWDVDVWGRLLRQSDGSAGVGTGVECGLMLFQCVRLAAGYSLNGFEEPDMVERDAWASGFGVRVQLLLSEWILDEAGL